MATDAQNVAPFFDTVSADTFANDEPGRLKALGAALRMLSRLQTPHEKSLSFTNEIPVILAAIRVFIDLGIWEGWYKSGGGSKSLEDLVKLAKPEPDIALLGTSASPPDYACFSFQHANLMLALSAVR